MRQAWLLFGIALVVTGCDARKLFGETWTVPKVCQSSNPDCVFQSGNSTKQQICEQTSGQCRACGKGPAEMSSFDLASGTKECRDAYQSPIVCDATTNECRSCRVGNQECVNSDKSKPVCDTGSGTCRPCTSGAAGAMECKLEGFITCSGGLCQPCALNADCVNIDPNTPFCDKTAASPVCRGCSLDSECDSQLCDNGKNPLVNEGKSGRCADKLSIAWVDSNAGCNAGTADGSETKPYCTIAAALGKSGVKYLLLKSSTTPYPTPAAINKEVSIFGKGADPSSVTINAIAFNGPGVKLGLTSLTIKDSGKSLVQCTGGSVTLLRTVLDGGTRGLDASGGCTEVSVQQTKVVNSSGAGLYITGSTKYTVVNTGVFKTAATTDGDGINLSTSGTGKFAFNTIRLNGTLTAVGGINCGSGTDKLLTNSVFVSNATGGTSQLTGSCQLTKVVVGLLDQTSLQGAIKANPKFIGIEGTLDPAADTACIDKGDADAEVIVDYFGGKRPLGNAPDIGYHEAK